MSFANDRRGTRQPTRAEMESLLLYAEEVLANARAAADRLGVDREVSAATLLLYAYSKAVSDLAGPSGQRLNELTEYAAQSVRHSVPKLNKLWSL